MSKGIVLSLFDYTGNMVKPWAKNGYECYCVDLKHKGEEYTEDDDVAGEINYVGADIEDYIPPRREYRIAFAFPPCDNLAVSGARWFQEKGIKGLSNGVENFLRAKEICEWSDAPYMIENPVSVISSYWREPDFTFHPYEYDGYTNEDNKYQKRTCLWVGNGFVFPDKQPSEEHDQRIHQSFPSDDEERKEFRSKTPQGFANAVYEINEGTGVFDY